MISTEISPCQTVAYSTEFSEKSPEYERHFFEKPKFSTTESVENVENFLPQKTCISSKNVSNQRVKGQVINNPDVENVENRYHCGKVSVFHRSFGGECGKFSEKSSDSIISALLFQHSAFVISAIYQLLLPFLLFLADFLLLPEP